jgi:hypothetical protein
VDVALHAKKEAPAWRAGGASVRNSRNFSVRNVVRDGLDVALEDGVLTVEAGWIPRSTRD